MALPSSPNAIGTVAGLSAIILSSDVINGLAGTHVMVAAAALTGGAVPATILAYATLGAVSMLINFAVTHYAEAAKLDREVVTFWPMARFFTGVKANTKLPEPEILPPIVVKEGK